LPKVAQFLGKDFEKATADDPKTVIRRLEEMYPSASSRYELRKTIRKFYKWLNGGEEYTDCVKWIKIGGRKNNNKLPEELLTEDEIKKMIDSAWSIRDRALIFVL
jgi:site-specific recombinase XerD